MSVLRSSKVADTLLHMCVVCQPGFCYPDVGVDPMAGTTKEKAFKRNHISVVKLMLPDFLNAISSVIFQNALVKLQTLDLMLFTELLGSASSKHKRTCVKLVNGF